MLGEDAALRWVSGKSPHNGVSHRLYAAEFSYGPKVELGYARVSTAKQDLERQIEALTAVGIARERIYLDKKSGATVDRPGLRAVLGFARRGDVIVVHTLDRLGRTVRDTLHLIHELTERGIGVRNLADPIKVDSADPADPMGQLAVVAAGVVRPDGIDLHLRAGGARPGGGRRARPAGGPPQPAGPGGAGLRGAPARRRAHDGPDRGRDRDDPQQPVPVPTAPTTAAADRR